MSKTKTESKAENKIGPGNPRQPPERRRQIIKERIASCTQSEIAFICGVTERTITRDIDKMKESSEWEEWLEATLLGLMRNGEVSDTIKFREIAKLYGRTLTTRTRVETRGTMRVAVDRGEEIEELLEGYNHLFTETEGEEGDIREDDPGEPIHTSQADG